jgi:hypothetical protein
MAEFTASVEVYGLKALDEALRQLPIEVAGPIMEAALRAGGEVIRAGAVQNIRSRTGATAADLRVQVQVQPPDAGAAGIGGTTKGRSARGHVLRWLEFGTKAHREVAGAKTRRIFKKVTRKLARVDPAAAVMLIKRGSGAAHALAFGGHVYGAVNHPGIAGQSPLTRALAEQGDAAIAAFRDRLWSGIVAAANRLRR